MDVFDINMRIASFLSVPSADAYSRVNRMCLFTGRARLFHTFPISTDPGDRRSIDNVETFLRTTKHVARSIRFVRVIGASEGTIGPSELRHVCLVARTMPNLLRLGLYNLRWNPSQENYTVSDPSPIASRTVDVVCHRLTGLNPFFFETLRSSLR